MSEELVVARAKLKALYRVENKSSERVDRIICLEEKIARLEYREAHPNLVERLFSFMQECI